MQPPLPNNDRGRPRVTEASMRHESDPIDTQFDFSISEHTPLEKYPTDTPGLPRNKTADVPDRSLSALEKEDRAVIDSTSVSDLKTASPALEFLFQVRRDRNTLLKNEFNAAYRDPAEHPSYAFADQEKQSADQEERNGKETLFREISGGKRRSVGRFEIIRTLGKGGFAEVFLARDSQLDREVAIKIPHPACLISDDAQTRFDREARAAATLCHPSIIPVFENGNVGPVSYITYEYCPGTTLAEWMQSHDKPLPVRSAAQIVAILAEAVQHAHQRNVIHRDLKPGNVLVNFPRSGIPETVTSRDVRITDFGLAKHLAGERDQSLTVEGAVVGTPAYMAPEQARGACDVSEPADIYSLGVILYQLLTGRVAHKKSDHISTLRAVEYDEPKRPRLIRAEIPRDLEAICLKCLNKSPDKRFDSAHHLASDLERWLAGSPVTARHSGPLERLGRWTRRRPALAAALLFAFASLAAGLLMTSWKWRESENNFATSNQNRIRAERHLGQLEGTVEFVLDQYTDMLRDGVTLDATHHKILEQMLTVHVALVQDKAADVDTSPEIIANYRKISQTYRLLGDYRDAREFADIGIGLIDSSNSDLDWHDELLRQKYYLLFEKFMVSLDLDQQNRCNAELIELKSYIDSVAHVYDPFDLKRQYHAVYRHLGIVSLNLNDPARATDHHLKCFELINEMIALKPDDERLKELQFRTTRDLAVDYSRMGNIDESNKLLKDSIEQFDAMPERMRDGNQLLAGAAYAESKYAYNVLNEQPNVAEQHFLKCISMCEQLAARNEGRAETTLVRALRGLAEAYALQNRNQESCDACDRAVVAAKQLPDHPFKFNMLLGILTQKGNLLRRTGGEQQAINDLFIDAIAIAVDSVEKYPAAPNVRETTAMTYYDAADNLLNSGDETNALTTFDRAQEQTVAAYELNRNQPILREIASNIAERQFELVLKEGTFPEALDSIGWLLELQADSDYYYIRSAEILLKSIESFDQSAADSRSESRISAAKRMSLKLLEQAIERGFSDRDRLSANNWPLVKDEERFERAVGMMNEGN